MARDYKHRARKKRATKKTDGNKLWTVLGITLLLAVGIGGASYLYYQTSHTPKQVKTVTATTGPKSAKTTTAKDEPAATHFDFYTLLPKMEVEISDRELDDALKSLPKSAESGTYVLQAGSFRKFAEADTLKARLALLGIVAQIRTVIINNEETWYRVQVGPYSKLDDLKHARNRLKHNNIDFLTLKLTD
jgi:cell division protein FtsN